MSNLPQHDYRIFDTHTHVGHARHSGRVHTADQLLRDMDRLGIERSLVIPFPVVADYRAEHDLIGKAVLRQPHRLSGAACLDPFVPEQTFRDEVRRCREEFGFTALKLQPQYQGLNPFNPRSDFFFETVLENRMAVVCHTGSGLPFAAPSLLIRPALKYTDLQIIVAHCGGGFLVHEAMLAAALCPNITLELSSLMPHQIHEVLTEVPANRLMIGSDLPESLDTEIGKIIGLKIPEDDKRAILGGTAFKLFRLDE